MLAAPMVALTPIMHEYSHLTWLTPSASADKRLPAPRGIFSSDYNIEMDHKHFSAQVQDINWTQLTTISVFPLTSMSLVPQVFRALLVVTHHCKKNILLIRFFSWHVSTFSTMDLTPINSSLCFKATINL